MENLFLSCKACRAPWQMFVFKISKLLQWKTCKTFRLHLLMYTLYTLWSPFSSFKHSLFNPFMYISLTKVTHTHVDHLFHKLHDFIFLTAGKKFLEKRKNLKCKYVVDVIQINIICEKKNKEFFTSL